MIIVTGVLIPIILFLLTLPLQTLLKTVKGVISIRLSMLNQSTRKGDIIRNKIKSQYSTLSRNNKLEIASLKALNLLVNSISRLIVFLRTLASTLIGLAISGIVIIVPTFVLVMVSVISIITVVDNMPEIYSNPNNIVIIGGDLSSDSTNDTTNSDTVDRVNVAENVEAWLKSCEEMGRFYMTSINTYNQGGWYACNLLNGAKVRADCTGYMYASLIYAGLINDSPSNASSSYNWLKGGAVGKKLEQAGFECISAGQGFQWQTGDIAVIGGHVELIEYVQGDSLRAWGWGYVQTKFPNDFQPMSGFKHSTKGYYEYCYRLKSN